MDHAVAAVVRAPTVAPSAEPIRPDGSPRLLTLASTLYLCLPLAIFCSGWLRPMLGVPLAAAVFLAAVRSAGAVPQGGSRSGRRDMLAIVGLAVVVAWLTGAGGFGYQTTDWVKHNAMLHDLTVHPWPVVYDGDPDLGLAYYVGYYLPAAAVGKALGWWAANVALLAWTFLGLGLAFAWLPELTRTRLRLTFVAFFAWCGLDVVGAALFPLLGGGAGWGMWWTDGIEYWNGNFFSNSNLTHVLWATNHAVGGWIFVALVLRSCWDHRRGESVVLWGAATLLWAPFIVLGSLPLIMLARTRESWRRVVSPANAVGVAAGLVVLAYLGAKGAGTAAAVGGSGLDIAFVLTSPRVDLGTVAVVSGLLLFLLLEWLVPFGMIARTGLLDERETRLLRIAALTVLLCVPVKVGANHDLLIRGSMPALLILAVLTARVFGRLPGGLLRRPTLVVLLVLGSVTSAYEVRRTLFEPSVSQITYSTTDPDRVPSIPHVFGGSNFFAQYVSTTDSFFWHVLAATPHPESCTNIDGSQRPTYGEPLAAPLNCG